MANFTSTHTGSVVDAAVTKITATSSSATELNILDGVTATTAELNILDGVTATTAEINILDGVTATAAEINILDGVTSTAAELNILDGVTSTAAELNILDGVTSTAAELNVLDGYTGSVTELNYLDTLHATGVTSTEFDYLDGVTSNIQTQLDAKIEATLTSEQVQDIVGAMFSSNTESGITVSYEDGDGTIDLTVATQSDNNFTTTLLNKLNAIEASADVTDTANVTSAGALMDSEVSNLSFVKSLTKGISDGNVLTANDAVADNDFLRIDGTEVEGRTAAEVRSDLNVEDGATADQTASEIKTLVGNASDSNVFTDADHSKLDGIEASADVTDATNVTAAGALMDSELTSIADVKALDQSVVSGATPTFTTTNFTDASNKRFMTDAQETKLDSVESNATADQTDEEIQDVVGAMFSSNTETGITATYQDGDGTIDLVVGTLNQDTTGTAAKVTVSDSTANTNFPVVFHDESNALLDDTGALRYNPSTGELLVPKLTVAGTTTQVDTVTMEAANAIIFEGATADAHETTLSIVDPTADHTQYLINQGGYIPVLAAATTTAITSTPAELNVLDGITSTTAELNILDGVTSTAAELNILDGVTATAAELNIMDGVTATTAELNYTDGVTSNIQTQLDATLDTAGTGIDISSTTISVDVSDFMSNGANNYVLTATGTDAMNAEANLTFDGTDLAIASSGKLLFGGGSHTYINEDIDDRLRFFTGGAEFMRFTEDTANILSLYQNTYLNDDLKLYFGSHSDVYLYYEGTNNDFYIRNANGDTIIRNDATDADIIFSNDDGSGGNDNYLVIDGGAVTIDLLKDTRLAATKKLYLDGGGNSYILESATDIMDFYAGGVLMLRLDETNNTVHIPQDSGDAVFTVGAGSDFQLYIDSDDVVMRNQTQDKDMKFIVNDGGSNVTAIQIDASEDARVKLPNDGQRLTLGASDDLQLLHNGTNSYIANYVGDLVIENHEADKDIIFYNDDGSGGTTAYLTIDGSASLVNFNKATRHLDSSNAYFGTNLDGKIIHDGSNFYVANVETGDLYIQNELNDRDVILRSDDGSGGVTAYITLDGSAERTVFDKHIRVNDNVEVQIGSAGDMPIYHNGTNSLIDNYTGSLIIQTRADDEDIILKSDDGSGGLTNYIQLDGSEVETVFNQKIKVEDSKAFAIGSGRDMKIQHDGSHNYIDLDNGNLYFRDDGDNNILIVYREGGGIQLSEGDLKIPATSKLYLDGGSDTYIHQSSNDIMQLFTGGENMLELSSAGSDPRISYFNKDNRDRDFSFCGDSNDHVLYFDASEERVGIGQTSPSAKLDIVATGDEGLEVTGGSGYLSAFFQTDFDTVAKFYSSDGTAQIELADNSSSSGYNTIGVQGNGAMFFKVNNSERMRIDSSGRLVVGATAAIATTAGTGASQVLGTGNSDTVFTIGRFSNNTGVGNINFLKSRNGTIGSNTIVQDGDGLGAITWAADDGSDFVSHAAKIDARIDGTPGANDTPGRLSFYTTADGSDSAVERMRIDSAGNMRFSDNASNPSASSNMAFIFNDGGEMKVLDELGNTTTISPHNFELIPEGASEDMAWSHHSVKGNKTVNVDMMKLARLVEQLTGEKLVYTEET